MPVLRDQTGHSVNLSVWGDEGPIVVRWDYGAFALPLTVRVGATLPLLSSSAGHVFLSLLPEPLTARARQHAWEANGASLSVAKMTAIRSAVKRTGVAIIKGSVIPGIASISAPILTSADSLPLVLSVVLPDGELTSAEQGRVTKLLLQTTEAVSHELGALA
jgi:DNA-binding IclR family transcriptional regulator